MRETPSANTAAAHQAQSAIGAAAIDGRFRALEARLAELRRSFTEAEALSVPERLDRGAEIRRDLNRLGDAVLGHLRQWAGDAPAATRAPVQESRR